MTLALEKHRLLAAIPVPLAMPGDSVVIVCNRSRSGKLVDGVVKGIEFRLQREAKELSRDGYWGYAVWVAHETPRRAGRGRLSTGYYCHVGDSTIEHNYTRPIDWDALRGGKVTA
jgi:hypothetical protein